MQAQSSNIRRKAYGRNFSIPRPLVRHSISHGRMRAPPVADTPTTEKSGFTVKDRITVLISLSALLISGVSSYFSFFRNETEVSVSILDARGLGYEGTQETTAVNVAIMNTGSRQVALIRSDIYIVRASGDNRVRGGLKSSDDAAELASITLIDPGKMTIVTVKAQSSWDEILTDRRKVHPKDQKYYNYQTTMGVSLHLLGSNGSRIEGLIDSIKVRFQDSEFRGREVDTTAVTLEEKSNGLASLWQRK